MMLFVKRYVTSLACLLVAFGVYWLFVVPKIEPPPRTPVPPPDFSGALGGTQWWQPLFESTAWQVQEPQILQGKNGMVLLAQSYSQLGPKTLELKPLTMVLPQPSTSSDIGAGGNQNNSLYQNVIIVNAEQGAVIHFEQPIDPSVAIPLVDRGHLNGMIEIVQRARGSNDAEWSIRTSELNIDRNRISTQQSVTIQWPEGIIQGRDLKLTMQGDLSGSNSQSSLPWGPVRTLELYHIDRMETRLAPGGLWSKVEALRSSLPANLASMPATLKVQCGGRFTFDFMHSRASLVSGIHAVHQVGSLPPDEFLSQELAVSIRPPSKDLSSREGPNFAGVEVTELEATGIDSLENFVGERKVELRAPTIDAYASAKRLRLNFAENRIELDGKLNYAGATQSAAWLKYLGYEFTAPRIDYDADGKDPKSASNHLGYLVALGAGEMRLPPDSSLGSGLVRWQHSLEMRPTPTPGLQWLGLFGSVLLEGTAHGYLASDKLEVWLRRAESPADPSSVSALQSTFTPERVKATGKTTLATEQISADVRELNLTFRFLVDEKNDEADSGELTLADASGRPMHQWLQNPDDSSGLSGAVVGSDGNSSAGPASSGPSAGSAVGRVGASIASKLAPDPIKILGAALDSVIVVSGKQSWVEILTVSGPLEVAGPPMKADQSPWSVSGDQLQLATNVYGQVDLQVTGQPAKIGLSGGSLEGSNIRFDQSRNLIWMNEPGEFIVPTEALAAAGASQLKWFEAPHCTWQGKMLFDGQSVHIQGDVRFDGAFRVGGDQFWWIRGHAEALQVELSERVDLGDLESAALEPKQITISKNVNILASQLDSAGNKRNRQQIQLPTLTFEIGTNEITGLGPASIRSWHLAESGSVNALGQAASGQIGRPASSRTDRSGGQLHGAHLVFRDSMRAFLDRSEIYFQGKVEMATGPLASWDAAIDLAQMQHLEMNQMLLDCDLLKVYDTSGLSSTASLSGSQAASKAWEFQARGNVNFAGKAESGDYEGDGSEVTYTQSKELLMLWGEPKRPAKIVIKPAERSAAGESLGLNVINLSVAYAAINPRTPSIERWELGENGLYAELPGANTSKPDRSEIPPGAPNAAPNPRGTVGDFFQRK